MKIKSDEYVVSEEFGWMHLDDGEGTTRISMPKDVWIDLCKKTLEHETQSNDDIKVEFIDNEISGDYWKVSDGDRMIGQVWLVEPAGNVSGENWACEITSSGMTWDMIDSKQEAIDLVVEEVSSEKYSLCRICGR